MNPRPRIPPLVASDLRAAALGLAGIALLYAAHQLGRKTS